MRGIWTSIVETRHIYYAYTHEGGNGGVYPGSLILMYGKR